MAHSAGRMGPTEHARACVACGRLPRVDITPLDENEFTDGALPVSCSVVVDNEYESSIIIGVPLWYHFPQPNKGQYYSFQCGRRVIMPERVVRGLQWRILLSLVYLPSIITNPFSFHAFA